MSHPCRIEHQIFVQRDGQHPTGKLQRCQVAFRGDGVAPISGADAKEGKISPAGEIFEVAGSMRHTVDLMERIGKVGDSSQGTWEHPKD